MNLKKNGKVFTSKSVGTGPSSYEKKNLPGRGLTKVEKHWYTVCPFYRVSEQGSSYGVPRLALAPYTEVSLTSDTIVGI